MTGPSWIDYGGDRTQYEDDLSRFDQAHETDRSDEKSLIETVTNQYTMQIDQLLRNAQQAIDLLHERLDAFQDRSRQKYDLVTVGVFQGKIDLLRSLGLMPSQVAGLQGRIDEIRSDVCNFNAKEVSHD